MSDVDKSGVTQAENVSGKPRRRGCLGHCARFWWAYLIALIVVVVIVVPCVLLVAVPHIAQQKIDDAHFALDGIRVTNTQAQNLTMAIDSTITSDGSIHATIDGFQGVMYLEDLEGHTPFANINFPQTTSDAFQTVNITQNLPITDVHALTVFNTWLLVNETLNVTVSGDTNVHVSGIDRAYGVHFQKTFNMPGLNSLAGIVVNQTSFSLSNDTRGNNFNGTAYIPNHSLVAFELGNVSFHNYFQGEEIGTVYIDNLTLQPGWNVAPMRAYVSPQPLVAALGTKEYCQGANKGILPFVLSGKTDVNHGQPLPYFNDALASLNRSVLIDAGTTLKNSLNLTIPCNTTSTS